MDTPKEPPSVACIRFVRCSECGKEIDNRSISGACISCQQEWGRKIANPRNFEGRYFKFQRTWFVPVQMATGDMMPNYIAPTAKAAWASFTRHYWTKKERMAEGWRVKRIRITPDWRNTDD